MVFKRDNEEKFMSSAELRSQGEYSWSDTAFEAPGTPEHLCKDWQENDQSPPEVHTGRLSCAEAAEDPAWLI